MAKLFLSRDDNANFEGVSTIIRFVVKAILIGWLAWLAFLTIVSLMCVL